MKFFEGALVDYDNLKEEKKEGTQKVSDKELKNEKIKPRKNLDPILKRLSEHKPPILHWLGTSFGVTKELFGFWKKSGFIPIYMRQQVNELTGEHTTVMIKPLALLDEVVRAENELSNDWVQTYYGDFKRRMLNLLGYDFRHLSCSLVFQFIGHTNPNQG